MRLSQADTLLRTVFGYSDFRGHQSEIINHVIQGGDCLVLMPTGGGKSLCYQIPAILREGVGIVVSPLIALMQNQVEQLKQRGVRVAYLSSLLSQSEIEAVEQDLQANHYDLLYVAPERLLAPRFLALLQKLSYRCLLLMKCTVFLNGDMIFGRNMFSFRFCRKDFRKCHGSGLRHPLI